LPLLIDSMSNTSLLAGWRSRWNRSLFQFLGRRVRTRMDIEDLAQETYLRILRTRDLTDVRNPQAYLLRVAGHVLLEWREHQPRPEALVSLEDDDLLVDGSSPEVELEATLSQQRLDEVLAALTPRMRAVLLLRLRDQRSCKDIAKDLDITVRQVRRYLVRGYERLRTAVED
jgi:RNA polymerase sigma factor (sigma-70 family)